MRGNAARRTGPYQLGQLPDRVLFDIAKQLVHRLAIGHSDITGDDFGTIFAGAIGAEHRGSPLGIADVVLNGCAWSVKTVQLARPYRASTVRLISGRCSPDYSLDITDPRKKPEDTGRAVLSIWNARVNEALNYHDDLRILVMIRNMATREYRIFEEEAQRFTPTDYEWKFNKPRNQGNLQGYDRVTGAHRFTWQPHGSQFTILRDVPASARRFSINPNVPTLSVDAILTEIGFDPKWITVYGED